MDRIRKALDLARQERERSFEPIRDEPAQDAGAGAGSSDCQPSPFSTASRGRFEPPPGPTPQLIRYSRTPSFVVSLGLLESHRILTPEGAAARSTPDGIDAAFRILRTQVLLRLDEQGWRSMAILSPGSEDGKTTTAINLAISLAQDQRHTVLLVDFDLKRPTIAERFGLTPEKGADDLLSGRARIEECLAHPEGFDRLVLLPARDAAGNSSELLTGHRCRALVTELRSRYPERILLFDLPPILGADDALGFVPLVDCALMVISEGYTRRADVLRSMELLRTTPVLGTVLNRATHVNSAYG